MAMPAVSCFGSVTSLLLAILCAVVAVAADASTSAEKDVPQWASNSALQLMLSSQPGLQFTAIPLTGNLGLNESDRTRGIVRISGNLKPANMSNYNQITSGNDVAYLSCDRPNEDGFLDPDTMLNALMASKPKAIVLYSTSKTWCSINDDETLPYTSILTMADPNEASNVLGRLNSTRPGLDVNVLITGNATDDSSNGTSSSGGGGGNNSAIAMSILYSITGLITVLFLIIIATGAIRAHRHPERYGPRGAFGGRPRQSRAKGIARAVLDTIPIVKFGNQEPTKPDPEQELDTATTNGREVPAEMTAPDLTEEGRPDAAATSRRASHDSAALASRSHAAAENENGSDSHLGCSICTEDFKHGEDVRVLPCNHRFHPGCIDPWLVNVSGTCPLCRLDLRPGQGNAKRGSTAAASNGSAADSESIAPPLALEGEDEHAHPGSHARRLSRLFDVNRLRQASVEERMEALRQMRAQANEHASPEGEDVDERRRGARLTDRLKDKFRIRTRAEPAERREG